MVDQKIELAFTLQELGILWDALSHKERYHREAESMLEQSANAYAQRALEKNEDVLTRVKMLAAYLEEAMQQLENQALVGGDGYTP